MQGEAERARERLPRAHRRAALPRLRTPELFYNVVHAAAPLASRCAPDLSPAVDAVLARALAKKPDDRFACAADLATALAQALSDRNHA